MALIPTEYLKSVVVLGAQTPPTKNSTDRTDNEYKSYRFFILLPEIGENRQYK